MQLFGRSNRAGGDIGSNSLRWRFASFKGAPIVHSTQMSEEYGSDQV